MYAVLSPLLRHKCQTQRPLSSTLRASIQSPRCPRSWSVWRHNGFNFFSKTVGDDSGQASTFCEVSDEISSWQLQLVSIPQSVIYIWWFHAGMVPACLPAHGLLFTSHLLQNYLYSPEFVLGSVEKVDSRKTATLLRVVLKISLYIFVLSLIVCKISICSY